MSVVIEGYNPGALLLRSLISLFGLAVSLPAQGTTVDFNREVRPILAGHCFTCHGPDAAQREGGASGSGGLRLDTADGAQAALEDGRFAIVPGHANRSELVRRVRSSGRDRMPPAEQGPGLSETEIRVLERWIEGGADYAPHWSFVAPRKSAVPEVARMDWVRDDLDRFVLAGLEERGLTPQRVASRDALLRRVTLDLTGLPPTLAEVDAFQNDESADAYDRVVERLLASPAFGEHMARHWLDIARYADTAGYADDPRRTIWAYRDWVIRAFQENKPFDEFTIEQLAGDLLPDPRDDQLVATAFHRNTMTNNEGGTDDEEFRSVAVVDRVNTTMAAWTGMTLACAQCHDHKYDPFSQREYFELFALFNTTQDSDKRDERPTLELFTEAQRADAARWRSELADARTMLKADTPQYAAERAKWDRGFPRSPRWQPLESAGPGVTALRITGAVEPPRLTWRPADVEAVPARFVRVSMPGKSHFLSLAEVEVFEGGENVALEGVAKQISTDYRGPARLAIDGNTDGHYQRAKSTTHTARGDDPWWEVDLQQTRAIDRVRVWNRTDNDGVKRRLRRFRVELLDEARTVVFGEHFEGVPDPDVELSPGGARGVQVVSSWREGPGKEAALICILDAALDLDGAHLEIGGLPRGARVEASADPAFEGYRDVPGDVLAALAKPLASHVPGTSRADVDLRRIDGYFRSISEVLAPTRAHVATLEKSLKEQRPHTTVPILREQPEGKRRATHVHVRGNFMQEGERVGPGVPAALRGAAANPATRLELARWLVSAEHPLTSRVIVNRFWELLFGRGLVSTSDDFGTRGELPSHPELLDTLAVDFVESGWDVKRLLSRIVRSATYMQDSRCAPELREIDPHNQWLARGPRTRLTAEMIRDQALAIGGLLSQKMFGPPVRPPRPSLGLRAAFGGSTDWRDSTGEDRFRRALYTLWQRSVPYPSLAEFDAPNRDVCSVRRIPTNTPLQALVTLNDPVYVEAAQGLARRMHGIGEDPGDRVAHGFRLCLGRAPNAAQRQRLVELFESARERYAADAAAALALATEPIGPLHDGADAADLAALTVVANVLLNLDEVLIKR